MTPHAPLDLNPLPTALILVVVTFGYIGAVVQWPFITCRRCSGTGKRRPRIALFGSRAFRICRRCAGTGRRLRPARKAWNYLHGHRTRALTASRTANGNSVRAANRAAARDIERNAR